MLNFIALAVVVSPAVLLLVLGVTTLVRYRLSEIAVARCAQFSSFCGLFAALCMLTYMLATDVRYVPLVFGSWVTLENDSAAEHKPMHLEESTREDHAAQHSASEPHDQAVIEPPTPLHDDGAFHLRTKFVFDRLSIPFAILSLVLCGVIGAFAFRYLHLEEGYHRFFLYYSIFQLGMVVTSLAGTIETLFFGWELVGLSSALLVAFFHDRAGPVQNGLRVWSVYRIADAAFLIAALTMHHLSGSGDFEAMMGQGAWPYGQAQITEQQALLVGSLLLIAVAGKSALVPFSGWLPRAMEGPTPSSAVFYGALSVHLGAFLLLRVSAILERSPLLSGMVIALGLITLVFAAMAARVQTDVKSALSYASLIQVSIIVVEIGVGLRYIPLIHIIGHACVRTLQLVRAPSLLKDYSTLENALGYRLPLPTTMWRRWLSEKSRERFYRFAFERGYLDSMIDDYVVLPFAKLLRWFDSLERRATSIMAGGKNPARSVAHGERDIESHHHEREH